MTINQELMESGTIMYLRENTEELKKFNQRQNIHAMWLKAGVILGYAGFLYLIIMTLYIIHFNVVNNALAAIAQSG